ncbi:phage protein [Staphylococcus aureus]|nr:phage protein [Staphylococcus aureus]
MYYEIGEIIRKKAIDEWIEENTDEQDRLINLVMRW